MTKELTIYEKMPDPIVAADKMAKWFSDSGMFGCKTHAQGAVLALACMVEGKTPLEISRTYHIIEGKLSMKADAMHAKFLEAGGHLHWKKTNEKECIAVFSHPDHAPKGVEVKTTLDELVESGVAKDKNGVKHTYKKFPRQMLRARVISEGVRMVCPHIISGTYTPEEISDFNPPIEAEVVPEKPKEEKPAAYTATKEQKAQLEKLADSPDISESQREYLTTLDFNTLPADKAQKILDKANA